tara:strand:+ start:973 stop:1878 length:906 start_codon:yes stop_codon:yes gene_type:complete
MNHFTSNILMISPEKFRSNEFTMDDNVFQSRKSVNTEVSKKVMKEFEKLKNTISDKGISVYSMKDDSIHDTPDSVFPNNWISFHNKHKAVIYPMFAENRRYERHSDTLKKLSKKGIDVQITHDYSIYENQNKFLEGTGSIVLDRNSKVAYCSLSMRSDQELFNKFCGDLNYRPVIFNSIYESKPIYHTNVLMSICSNFCIICLESIKNEDEKNNVIKSLENSSLEIIDITYNQMSSYLGNCIQLLDKDGNPVLVMSSSAINSISNQQLKRILNHTDIIHSDIKTIENYGGGSARCMIAEIF